MSKNFISTLDLPREALEQLLDAAARFKSGADTSKPLTGKAVGLIFFNPSLRTRASMQVAVYQLGGEAVILEPGGTTWTIEHRDGVVMDGDKTEHVAEFVRVLERYCSAIGIRTFATLRNWEEERLDPVISSFVKHASIPIINLESAMHHPCQSIADMMTIREKLGVGRKRVVLTWAWHPKPLPMAVPNSFALAAAQMGHDLTIAHPEDYDLDEALMQVISAQAEVAGGSVKVVHDMDAAFNGAEVIYAKSWGAQRSYGNTEQELIARARYRKKWIVDRERMELTNDAIFMHCLPVRRNVIVTDEVIDSPSSVVIDEAENRLHVQKAVLAGLLG
jgi:N-acetylornithine carbamoyltransferase